MTFCVNCDEVICVCMDFETHAKYKIIDGESVRIKEDMDNQITPNSVPKAVEQKIKTAIELKKQLEQYEKEIKDELLQAMIDNNIKSIKNDSYSITLATRMSYKPTGDIPEGYSKTVLDTTKVSTHAKLYGVAPEGIEASESKYITWRAK